MTLTLEIEKPAAGGRMIARHEGRVVLVSGAIPGERVTAEIETTRAGVLLARTVAVERPSADRREPFCDPACGGNTYAHVAYARQCVLKAEVVADAFARIAKHPLERPIEVKASPERGYRMRARLHVAGGRVGFFRENTHELCDAGPTAQLLPETVAALARVGEALRRRAPVVQDLELTENVAATERAVLIEPFRGAGPSAVAAAAALFSEPEFTGVAVAGSPHAHGSPIVSDTLTLAVHDATAAVTLGRSVRAFFQGNRYLLQSLVEAVLSRVTPGPLIDLYAGAGLFGVSWAALGLGPVIAVEGDRQSGEDLARNARPFGRAIETLTTSVEEYLVRTAHDGTATLLVDPPRTGMTKEATAAIVSAGHTRVVYVSCDVATLARDVRRFIDGGYGLAHVEAFDLFPNTPHVETLVVLSR